MLPLYYFCSSLNSYEYQHVTPCTICSAKRALGSPIVFNPRRLLLSRLSISQSQIFPLLVLTYVEVVHISLLVAPKIIAS